MGATELVTSRPQLNPALRDFWTAKGIRNRVLYGGRASSKSWDAAGFATFLANSAKLRILCTRQFQNKIEESVYALLKIQIERFGLSSRFEILNNKITNRVTGTEFLFYGLARNIAEVKSLEGIDILWIEEGHYLTEEQWDILEATIRKQGSQVWLIFNPKLATDFAYKHFVLSPPPNTLVRKINYDENPFLSDTMRTIIEALKLKDPDKYLLIYGGNPDENDEKAVIKRAWLMAALDAHKKLGIEITGSTRLGFDIADAGEDNCAMVEAKGPLATWCEEWRGKEDELLKSCAKVHSEARARGAKVIYDAIGVGATAGAKFNEINADTGLKVEHEKFFAGGKVYKPDSKYGDSQVLNKDFFSNIKAQAWWLVADRLRNTYNAVRNGQQFEEDEMIFIDSAMPNLDKLMEELCTPLRDYDKNGKVMVESKQDLADRGIASPNIADAFIMAFIPGVMQRRSWFS
jgi:phage terminase large subunit